MPKPKEKIHYMIQLFGHKKGRIYSTKQQAIKVGSDLAKNMGERIRIERRCLINPQWDYRGSLNIECFPDGELKHFVPGTRNIFEKYRNKNVFVNKK